MISLIDIGGNIRKYREKKNYTQEYVAEELGISRVQYGSIERGENDVTITRIYNIAKILGVSVAEILDLPTVDSYMANNHNSINGIVNDSKIVNKLIELYEDKIQRQNEVITKLESK